MEETKTMIKRDDLAKNLFNYLSTKRSTEEVMSYLTSYYPSKSRKGISTAFSSMKNYLGNQIKKDNIGNYWTEKDSILDFYNMRIVFRSFYLVYKNLEKLGRDSLSISDVIFIITSDPYTKVNKKDLTDRVVMRWIELMDNKVPGIKDSIKREGEKIYFTDIQGYMKKCEDIIHSLFACSSIKKKSILSNDVLPKKTAPLFSNNSNNKVILRVEVTEDKLGIFDNYIKDVVVLDKLGNCDLIIEGSYDNLDNLKELYKKLRGNEKILNSSIRDHIKQQIDKENEYLKKVFSM